jgi:hypothetical protein
VETDETTGAASWRNSLKRVFQRPLGDCTRDTIAGETGILQQDATANCVSRAPPSRCFRVLCDAELFDPYRIQACSNRTRAIPMRE